MKTSYLKLHFAVFLWGFTGVLGRLISLNEGLLVWYRILITVITLFIIRLFIPNKLTITTKKRGKLYAVGAVLALHWVCFYGAIKSANVSVGLICLSTSSFFTACLEPIMLRTRFNVKEVLLSLLAMLGIACIFGFNPHFRLGIAIGLVATLLSTLFVILNKKVVENLPPFDTLYHELTGGLIGISLFMPLYMYLFPTKQYFPTITDVGWLFIMSWLCTIVAMLLSLQALQKMSAFAQNLILNMEPVYGILLAFVIFHENKYIGSSFYIGLAFLLSSVALHTWLEIRK